jgi:tRNA1(Val) A37 N6-methylase TrmN6
MREPNHIYNKALDKARESGQTQAMDLLELLQWAEQAVLANGQAAVALKYQRRFEIMTTIMSVKEAQDLLKIHEEDFSKSGTLFQSTGEDRGPR